MGEAAAVQCRIERHRREAGELAEPVDAGERFHYAPLPRAEFDELLRATDLRPQLVIAGQKGWLTDDLYTFALPKLKEIQLPANVHFSDAGSAVLAEQVASAIEQFLPRVPPKGSR